VKLAVGYPAAGGQIAADFVEAVAEYRDHIEEVYFAAPGQPSGRAPARDDGTLWNHLRALRRMGLKLDLLLNANCYGAAAASRQLADAVCRVVDQVTRNCGVHIVTTTSPFIAASLRGSFPTVDLRASVNMRIGTVQGLEILGDLFDSFCAQRDHNRDLERVKDLRDWCHARGKRLSLLVNSGCLAFCSAQTYHDNLIAHMAEVPGRFEVRGETTACQRFLRDPRHWPVLLSATWVRPEDLHRYEGLTDLAKLATRKHPRPSAIIAAYARGEHRGNLLDLLEPGHGALLGGGWIDNAAFPPDWFERTTDCGRRCWACGYCQDVLERVLVRTRARASAGPAER